MSKKLSRRNILKGLGYATCGGLVHATMPLGSRVGALATAAPVYGAFAANPV
jgi:hypothetical protein